TTAGRVTRTTRARTRTTRATTTATTRPPTTPTTITATTAPPPAPLRRRPAIVARATAPAATTATGAAARADRREDRAPGPRVRPRGVLACVSLREACDEAAAPERPQHPSREPHGGGGADHGTDEPDADLGEGQRLAVEHLPQRSEGVG